MKVILFDADGVLTLPEEFFSVVYAKSHGLDQKPFDDFFKNDWAEIVTGKVDLKDSIEANPDLWQWSGTPDELLDYWFKTEDVRNDEMIDLIKRIRGSDTLCYLATEQDKYRGEYMRNVMFKELFDGYFITAELGVKKSNPIFFEEIVKSLNKDGLNIKPKDILFFDDSQSKVDSAVAVGIDGCLFDGVQSFKEKLTQKGVL